MTNQNTSPGNAELAGCIIGLMGTNGSSAAPEVERLLNHRELEVRRAATNALRRIRGGKL